MIRALQVGLVLGAVMGAWSAQAGEVTTLVRTDGNRAVVPEVARNSRVEHGQETRMHHDSVKNDRSAFRADAHFVDHEAKSAKMAAFAGNRAILEQHSVDLALMAPASLALTPSLAPLCVNSYCATTGQMLAVRADLSPLDAVKKA